MSSLVSTVITSVIIDVLSLILAGLPFAILSLIDKPYQRGYFCNDDSIKYPYTAVGLIVPILTILETEAVLHYCKKTRKNYLPYPVTTKRSIPCYVVSSV